MAVMPAFVLCPKCKGEMYDSDGWWECQNEECFHEMPYWQGRVQWHRRVKKEAKKLAWWYAAC